MAATTGTGVVDIGTAKVALFFPPCDKINDTDDPDTGDPDTIRVSLLLLPPLLLLP